MILPIEQPLIDALQEEIDYLKRLRFHSSYTFYDGALLSVTKQDNFSGQSVSSGYYRFKNAQLINLAPDTGAVFTLEGEKHGGFIQFCDRYGIEVVIENYTADKIDSVSVEIESWRLLEIQRTRLSNLKQNPIVQLLSREHEKPSPETDVFFYGKENAITHAKRNPITVIWGPPGTGKTYTLAKIALSEAEAGRRVLILSQSNIAVDSAIIQIRKALTESEEQEVFKSKIFRYGMVRSPELLQYRSLLSWDAAFDSRRDLKSEYERLSKVLADDKKKSSQEISTLNGARYKILNEISNIEMNLIKEAKIVAMTATKATISKQISAQPWDTVIFDEISMAYISQITIAASMANKKLVLIGDFKQLAPIVQNEDSGSLLKKDIFSYLNIVKNGKVRRHPWLVMLNTQWRMHPDIVKFANRRIYEGKLKTAPESMEETSAIATRGPFPSSVFAYIDYSNFNGTCFSTRTGSRFNLFSAALTVKIALEAINEGQSNIGIVTPYAAQSRLINALLQDIETHDEKRLPIFCATIHQFQGSERDVIIFDSVESLPKREAGKIISSEDDSSMRLINVALTRTRGKFIIIGNNEYLRMHQAEISQDMWELIKEAKSKCYIVGEAIEERLMNKNGCSVMRFFPSVNEALSSFQTDLLKCNVKTKGGHVDYWHAPRNYFSSNPVRFENFLNYLVKNNRALRFFSSDSGITDVQKQRPDFPQKIIWKSSVAPKDDFVLIKDTTSSNATRIIWLNMISVCSNSDNGKRIPYAFKGNNVVNQFDKLAELDRVTQLSTKKTVIEIFLEKRYKCHLPNCPGSKGIKLQKAKSGKYYITCANCGKTILPYIPNDDLRDYVEEYDFRCKTCDSKISISKYGRPYCTKEHTHKVGYEINDIIEKDPPTKKAPPAKESSTKADPPNGPRVTVVKRKK